MGLYEPKLTKKQRRPNAEHRTTRIRKTAIAGAKNTTQQKKPNLHIQCQEFGASQQTNPVGAQEEAIRSSEEPKENPEGPKKSPE